MSHHPQTQVTTQIQRQFSLQPLNFNIKSISIWAQLYTDLQLQVNLQHQLQPHVNLQFDTTLAQPLKLQPLVDTLVQ